MYSSEVEYPTVLATRLPVVESSNNGERHGSGGSAEASDLCGDGSGSCEAIPLSDQRGAIAVRVALNRDQGLRKRTPALNTSARSAP